jgi:hypothetical protein
MVVDIVESPVDGFSVLVEALVDEDLVARRVTERLALRDSPLDWGVGSLFYDRGVGHSNKTRKKTVGPNDALRSAVGPENALGSLKNRTPRQVVGTKEHKSSKRVVAASVSIDRKTTIDW